MQKLGTITDAWSATRVDIITIELLKRTRAKSDIPPAIKFKEFVVKNSIVFRNTIKEKCQQLKEFNSYWWTRVLSGDRGSSNYEIEISHADF